MPRAYSICCAGTSNSATFARAILLLVVYSVGLALPFLLAALSFGGFLHSTSASESTCMPSNY